MIPRQLGPLEVGMQGLGCMGMSAYYGRADRKESIATIRKALDHGVSLLDTADLYGDGDNERLVGEAVAGRTGAVVATKFGIEVSPHDPMLKRVRGDAAYVRAACERSLRRLGRAHIDLYYLHRVDDSVPIEETIGAMSALVQAGKVRCIGLSEAGAETIRKAHATHPVTALQSEWSLWSRDVEHAIVPACRSLGIAVIAYSPLGRGLLAGQFTNRTDLAPEDYRLFEQPRFAAGNFERNVAIAAALRSVANDLRCTPAQAALAWVHYRGRDVIPIPGTTRRAHLMQNIAATTVGFTAASIAAIESAAQHGQVSGERCAPEHQHLLGR